MAITISDELLRSMNLTDEEARVEIACLLYDAGVLHMWPAARLARLSRDEFQSALLDRGLPLFRPTEESLRQDLAAAGYTLAPALNAEAAR